jgi:hypothetical protein
MYTYQSLYCFVAHFLLFSTKSIALRLDCFKLNGGPIYLIYPNSTGCELVDSVITLEINDVNWHMLPACQYIIDL